MCPEQDKYSDYEEGSGRRVPFPFLSPKDNPLYDYLIDLYWKRVSVVDALAPRRHVGMQLWVFMVIVGLRVMDISFQWMSGLGTFLLLIFGIYFISYSPFVAGHRAKLRAAVSHPSPLDFKDPLGIIFDTPLTENEIVQGIVRSSIQYPFMLMPISALPLYFFNMALWVTVIILLHGKNSAASNSMFYMIVANIPFIIGIMYMSGITNAIIRLFSVRLGLASQIFFLQRLKLGCMTWPFALSVIVVMITSSMARGSASQNMFAQNQNFNFIWIAETVGIELAAIVILAGIQVMLLPGMLKIVRRV